MVFALPKASITGLVWTTWSSNETFLAASPFLGAEAPTKAKYVITFFVFSVFPAPDSPVIRMDWFLDSKETHNIYEMCKYTMQNSGLKLKWCYFILMNIFSTQLTHFHGMISRLGNSKDMRWDLVTSFQTVNSNSSFCIDRKPSIRVHSDTEQTWIGLKYYRICYNYQCNYRLFWNKFNFFYNNDTLSICILT